MRIENLTSTRNSVIARVSASVIWEDSERASQEIYFETPATFADRLSCGPHAFLVACMVPAMRWGESRISIPEPMCPELREGLMTAMAWLVHWHGAPRAPVRIEAPQGARPPLPRQPRAGSFLSGGIDSLATLRLNRLAFPLDHPRSIRDCLFVHGFDIGALVESGTQLDTYQRALGLLTEVAEDAQVILIPVFTNVRQLDPDVGFWIHEYYGAALASVGHALAGGLSFVYVPGSLDVPNVTPVGSDPLLDPNYSSTELQIRYDGVRLSRLDKVRVVAEWDIAWPRMRVCTENPQGALNCGRCPKCIRTMLELLAVDRLGGCTAFPEQNVSADLLRTAPPTDPYDVAWYLELLPSLTVQSRHDLVRVIETQIIEYERHRKWLEEKDWKGAVKRFDRRFLDGRLFAYWKTLRPRVLTMQNKQATR